MWLSKGEINYRSDLTLSQIMEKTVEYQIGIHHLFTDFKSAYDTIHREKLLCAMTEFGIPPKLIRMVKATMTNVQCSVQIQSHLSEPISTIRGVRQGDALACLLFNIALEKLYGTLVFKPEELFSLRLYKSWLMQTILV